MRQGGYLHKKIFSMYYIFISLRDVNILLGTKMIIENRGENNISGKTLYRNRIHDVMNKSTTENLKTTKIYIKLLNTKQLKSKQS